MQRPPWHSRRVIQIYSGLWVIGDDLVPAAVMERLGDIDARTLRRRGERIPNGRRSRSGHVWIVTDDAIRTSIEESLDDLFVRLDPVWAAVQTLSTRFGMAIESYVKVYDGPPDADRDLGFHRRHVAR